MKKLACLLVLSVLAAGCHGMGTRISGSGNRERQKREVPPFTSISTEGAFNIEVTCQKDLSLEVEGDDNVLEYVTADVGNNILRLKSTKNYLTTEPVKFKISVPNLEGLAVNGAGRIEIKGIKNDRFEIDSNGAATIVVSGDTKVIDVGANGAGQIDAQNLRASRGVVDSKGVTRIDLDVSDHLDATVNGSSTVTYRGDPVVNKTVNGPGKVERRRNEGA